ncbi:MAG: GH3 auxin-responsive promoter family protein [Synechococcales bacterium]|nr:GH3 auxin-responsive promoter family protein [Synechococcales bacterium]
MANLVFSLMEAIAHRAKANFLQQLSQADRVQTAFLRSLLTAHQHTEFGQTYQLGDIHTPDQFRERVPIASYQDFLPAIERMAHGEANVLVADPLIFMNLTSGSTGPKKLIPVTRRSRRAIARANRAAMGFLFDAARREGRPLGKMLFNSSASSMGKTSGGIAYGPVSTSDLRLSNFLYRQVFAYPFEVLQVADSPSRHYLCLLFALGQPHLRVISATFPVLALQLASYLEKYADSLIDDLATGAIAPWLVLKPEQRLKLERQWAAQPQRAQQLRTIFKREGRLTPILAWPGLSFMVTARGGTSDFYFKRFSEYFGDTPVFGGIYSSAEATYGIHRDFNTDSVLLALNSGFYEFIPENQWEVTNPETVLPWEVTPGDRYRIVVTNYSGFYRYDVGDVVEVEGFTGNTPRFTFRHRRGGIISSTTEKTTEFHVVQTLQRLQQEFNLQLEQFCITLAEDVIPAPYLVNIELAAGSHLTQPEAFRQRFDAVLQEVNASYAAKRADHQVPAPRLRILAPGSFAALRQRMIQQGTLESQIKFPLVTENRAWLAGLLVEHEVRAEEG